MKRSAIKKSDVVLNILPWLIPALFIIFWQISVMAGWTISSFTLPPWSVLKRGVSLFKKGALQESISISLYRASVGFVIGGGIGSLLGVINGVSHVARMTFDSTIQMLRSIPHLALIPVVILVLGIGETTKISLVTIGYLFSMYINTYHGTMSVDSHLVEMGKSYGLSRLQMFRKITFPGVVPTILMGVRYALGVMWTTLIVAETVSTDSGIGYMSINAQQFMNMKTIFPYILIYALLGKLSDLITKNLEDILLDWRN